MLAEAIVMIPKSANKGTEIQMNVLPLVLCKDCKWFIKKFENEGRCIKHDNDYHEPDWFCADGEKAVNRNDDQRDSEKVRC